MAALGAAAGAFEGDNAREEQRARRAGLGLQAASLAQQDRQFAERQKLERESMALDADRIAGNQRLEAERTAMMQRNADRQFGLQERKLGQDVQNTAFEQQRLVKQDAWADALNEQKIRENEESIAFQKERFSQFKTLAEQERQTIAERKRLAQTALASAMKIGMENGGVVPLSVVQAVAKETGIPFQGMYFAQDGSFVSDVLKDNKVVQEVTPANVQSAIMRSMPGVFGDEAAKDLMTERRDKARAAELSKAGERLLNIRLGRIERERSAILKELEQEDAKVMLGDKEYQKRKDRLMQLDKDEDAAVYSAYGENTPAPSGENDMLALLEGGTVAPKEKPASKIGFVKGGSSGEVVERTLKNGQKALVRQLPNGKWEVVGGVPQEQIAPVMEEQPKKRPFRGVDGPRVTSSSEEVKRNFGPEPGTVEYWRDMPKGQATGMSKREIGFARRDILKRLEAAYRKGPKGRDEAAAVKAELDAFNDKYPV